MFLTHFLGPDNNLGNALELLYGQHTKRKFRNRGDPAVFSAESIIEHRKHHSTEVGLRFEFRTTFLIPESEWKTRRVKGSDVGLTYPFIAGGLNEVANEALTRKLSERLLADFGVRLEGIEKKVPEPLLDHSGVQQMVFELGTLQHFYSHKEYGMGRERLDVVWRRVEGGSPTYVFEVQVGGDLYHALGKLKHAYDKWNSHPILVLKAADISKAKELLSGTFHEAREKVKLIALNDIQDLYRKKKEWSKLEKTLGILT